ENYRIVYEPFGVCVCIAPWNYPLSMFNSGVVPALIAGNTVVFKPSEYTTLSQKLALDLLNQTGLPEGVLEIVYGAGDIGEILTDQHVDLIWFTGSAKAGQIIYKKAGEKFIKAICELGGSSAGIVFADADLELALNELYFARFSNCGQICSAVKRLFVEEKIFEEVVRKFVQKLQQVKMGNPTDAVDFGPLVNKKQLEMLKSQVQDAVEKGAKVEIGGKVPEDSSLKGGNYFEPTILTNVNSNMKVMTEEVFGPVLPIVPFKTEEEAVEMANNTEYGLSSEVYTKDLEKGERIAKKLQSGAVAINTDGLYKPMCPIGGYKKSGIGREYGKIGMQEFAQVKLIAVKKPL
ncbi:MAG: aldehyde dehydrogenase family protein, partial [bacterium]|nr:aldehyde dehydrogenase family protein [bacterium]